MEVGPKDLLSDDVLDGNPPSLPDEVGELAIDVYEDEDSITIKAPMAGVKAQDLDLSITDETVTIKGKRQSEHAEKSGKYLIQEAYWGAFERTYTLPAPIDSEKAKAHLKDGLLTITLPKTGRSRTKVIEVKTE